MTLIKSISGLRGTIGGGAGEGLNPLDIVTVSYTHLVHDVDMYPLRLTFVNHFNVSCQITKIGRENRRGYDWFHNVMF